MFSSKDKYTYIDLANYFLLHYDYILYNTYILQHNIQLYMIKNRYDGYYIENGIIKYYKSKNTIQTNNKVTQTDNKVTQTDNTIIENNKIIEQNNNKFKFKTKKQFSKYIKKSYSNDNTNSILNDDIKTQKISFSRRKNISNIT